MSDSTPQEIARRTFVTFETKCTSLTREQWIEACEELEQMVIDARNAALEDEG